MIEGEDVDTTKPRRVKEMEREVGERDTVQVEEIRGEDWQSRRPENVMEVASGLVDSAHVIGWAGNFEGGHTKSGAFTSKTKGLASTDV